MMKLAVTIFAVLALSTPMDAYHVPRVGTGALADEVQDFADILPLDDMVAILFEYMAEDAEFQKVVAYVQTPEFKNLISDLEAMPEVRNLMDYAQKAGLDVYYLVNKANRYLGLTELTPPAVFANVNYKITGGVRGFLDDVEALIPYEKVRALYRQKLATSKVFADFVEQLKTPAFQRIVDGLCSNSNFNALLAKAKAAGVDVAAVKELLQRVLGLNVPCGF
ncbi:Protein G12 [Anthophora quadrimaculata]